ncbi:MAG: nucleotidyltransferase domain-containing protein [Firmicutes bacterium]|nr:nucleotidyltransferase domain-containing protein [Bacillota bacterium]
MKSQNKQVLDWAVETVRTKYPDDIAILAVYGSYVNGTSHPLSDVDFFFIPKNKRGYEAARTFIIGGIGYDLFPMSWERVEGLSCLKEAIVPLLGDSLVAYHSSEEDLRRFMSLRARLCENLANRGFMLAKALEALGKAEEGYRRMLTAEGVRKTRSFCGRVLLALSDAMAYSNGTYFHKGLKGQYDDLRSMASLPEGFLVQYDACIEAGDVSELRSAARSMLALCRSHLKPGHTASELESQPVMPATAEPHSGAVEKAPVVSGTAVDYKELVSLYEEALSTFNKVYHYCSPNVNDHRMAFISAINLQQVLDEEVQALGLDVLTSFDHRDLQGLAACAKSAEARLVSFISEGADIRRFADFDEFSSNT